MAVIGAIFITFGVVFGSLLLVRGELFRAMLGFFFGFGFGLWMILWSGFDAEARTERNAEKSQSTMRGWLTDLLIITVLSGSIAAELYVNGTKYWYVVVFLAVLLLPFVVIHYLNVVKLSVRPSLWHFLLRWLDRFRFSIPLSFGLAAGGTIVTRTVTDESPNLPSIAFFEACAQLVPLLALVLAVEARVYALGRGETAGRLILVVYTFAAMGLAEFVCLRNLAHQEVGRYDLAIVGGALVTVFVSILLFALLGPIESRDES